MYFPPSNCDDYHGLAVLLNYYNGVSLSNTLGYNNAICFNYDLIVSDLDFSKLLHLEMLDMKKLHL